MKRRFLAVAVAALLSGCGNMFDNCPGQKDCGSGCAPTGASCCPNGSSYCDAPYTCGGANTCQGGGGGGGGGTTSYYVSANGCTGVASVSYNGPNYSVCNGYYQAALAAHCTKILDNCR
jgi:hypothetical protein